MKKILWKPDEELIQSTNITRFSNWLTEKTGRTFVDYNNLHSWSINNIEEFWELFIQFSDIKYYGTAEKVLTNNEMPGAVWFEGVKLNLTENIFERSYAGPAIKYINENYHSNKSSGYKSEYSFSELKDEVAKCANALRKKNIKKGDKVAGYISNVPEAVIACLACASIGAVWSSTSPDFGLEAVIDRFSQIKPKIVFASGEYIYNGKSHSTEKVLSELKDRLKSIELIVSVPNYSNRNSSQVGISWDQFIAGSDSKELKYEKLDFNDELYIMFSSGTTGVPKCIVHGVGGTLLQHRKEHMLHCNINKADKLFYFTTTGWMMWNWQLSALASGATIFLYEGSPAYPNLFSIWDIVCAEKITHFGTSGRYIESCMKSENKNLRAEKKFHDLRSLMYTGSPLSPTGYEWVYNNISKNVQLAGISGGTDIISCFVLGNPVLPVYSGRIQCKALGVDVAALDENGREIVNYPGELVCRKPIPSMPLKFLNDPGDKKYFNSYFSDFDGYWSHGDFIEFDENGSSIIYGRSDATLNPGGVRIGCAEIYSALDGLNYIKGSLAAGWIPPGQSDEIIVLFVMLDGKNKLDENIKNEIRNTILKKNSYKHIPKYIFEISAIPVTRSGKPVELSIKAVLAGRKISNQNALENPEILIEVEEYRKLLLSDFTNKDSK